MCARFPVRRQARALLFAPFCVAASYNSKGPPREAQSARPEKSLIRRHVDSSVGEHRSLHNTGLRKIDDSMVWFVDDAASVDGPQMLITDDGFTDNCDWVFRFRKVSSNETDFLEHVRHGDMVCVQGDYAECNYDNHSLSHFLYESFPRLKVGIRLVTFQSDCQEPPPRFRGLLDDPRLLVWFTWNRDSTIHSKLHRLPIGLSKDRHGIKMIKALRSMKNATNHHRLNKIFINFNRASGSDPGGRSLLWRLSANWSYADQFQYPTKEDLYETIQKYRFVACPQGKGVDTHRVWEALYLGAIPIVLTPRDNSTDQTQLYGNLPIVQLENWEDLPRRWSTLKNMASFDATTFPQLTLNYWLAKIRSSG